MLTICLFEVQTQGSYGQLPLFGQVHFPEVLEAQIYRAYTYTGDILMREAEIKCARSRQHPMVAERFRTKSLQSAISRGVDALS